MIHYYRVIKYTKTNKYILTVAQYLFYIVFKIYHTNYLRVC